MIKGVSVIVSGESEREPIEVLVDEYLSSLRAGNRPTVAQYAEAHPHLAEEIQELFPLVAAMEGWKDEETAAHGGHHSLGGMTIDRLGDFRMVREIGRGGMGIVFEAVQESLSRRVAIKILPPLTRSSQKSTERFRREAQTAAALHHANIVPVFGVGNDSGFHYIVMQWIDGRGLDAVIRHRSGSVTVDGRQGSTSPISMPASFVQESGNALLSGEMGATNVINPLTTGDGGCLFDPRTVARLGLQAAEALEYAHAAGTLHRDIKPANLILDRRGNLWVADFGLARAVEQESISQSGDIVGTLLYLAPERLRGECDARSDIYSLGLTLLELLLGRPVFQVTDSGTVIERILRGVPVRPGALGIYIPVDLETILLKAVAVDSRDRYASAAHMASDLRAYLEDRPISARTPTRMEQVRRWCRRNPVVAALSSLVATLLLITVVVTTLGYMDQRRMRQRTEATLDTSLTALDTIYNRFATPSGAAIEPLTSGAVLSDEAAEMLQGLLKVYDELASQGGDTSKLQRESLKAKLRVADILMRLGSLNESAEQYDQAVAGIAKLRYQGPDDRQQWELRRVAGTQNRAMAIEFLGDEVKAKELREETLLRLGELAHEMPEDVDVTLALAKAHYLLGRTPANMLSQPTSRSLRPEPQGPPPPGRKGPLGRPEGPRGREPRWGPGPPPRRDLSSWGGFLGNSDSFAQLHTPQSDQRHNHLQTSLSLVEPLRGDVRVAVAAEFLRALTLRELARSPASPPETRHSLLDESVQILHRLAQAETGYADYGIEWARSLLESTLAHETPRPEMIANLQPPLAEALQLVRQMCDAQPQIPEYSSLRARLSEVLAYLAMYNPVENFTENNPSGPKYAEQLIAEACSIQKSLTEKYPDDLNIRLWQIRYQISEIMLSKHHLPPHDLDQRIREINQRLQECEQRDPASATVAELRREWNVVKDQMAQPGNGPRPPRLP